MPVKMELKRIIISEIHEQQVVMLKEVDGDRSFSIMIGIFEATSIDRRVKRLPSPRPLTHDLVTSVIDNLGGELRDIYISELKDHTYYAKLRIRQNGEMVEVDSRPSDAIALARGTLGTIRGNLTWAFGYNIAAIPLAAAGFLNPLIAGAAMAASSAFVVGNSVRLRRFRAPSSAGPEPLAD